MSFKIYQQLWFFTMFVETTRDDHILDLILSTDSGSACDISIMPSISTSDHNVGLIVFILSNNNATGETDSDRQTPPFLLQMVQGELYGPVRTPASH